MVRKRTDSEQVARRLGLGSPVGGALGVGPVDTCCGPIVRVGTVVSSCSKKDVPSSLPPRPPLDHNLLRLQHRETDSSSYARRRAHSKEEKGEGEGGRRGREGEGKEREERERGNCGEAKDEPASVAGSWDEAAAAMAALEPVTSQSETPSTAAGSSVAAGRALAAAASACSRSTSSGSRYCCRKRSVRVRGGGKWEKNERRTCRP